MIYILRLTREAGKPSATSRILFAMNSGGMRQGSVFPGQSAFGADFRPYGIGKGAKKCRPKNQAAEEENEGLSFAPIMSPVLNMNIAGFDVHRGDSGGIGPVQECCRGAGLPGKSPILNGLLAIAGCAARLCFLTVGPVA